MTANADAHADADADADADAHGQTHASGRTGVIVRAGEAIEITRRSGTVLVVTVSDGAAAAALLNGLVAREAATR